LWDGGAHWEYDALRLGEDRHGTWLGAPHGTPLRRPGAAFVSGWDHVALVPDGAGFLASFYSDASASPVRIYVDITTLPTWDGTVVRSVDLDLDVVRDHSGRVFVDDEDEFAEHRVRYGYPEEIVRLAERTCAEVLRAVEAAEAPFDGATAAHWLEVLAGRS
jgi:predicted RNA-binding protein associated with RNAse of E/G family